MLGSNFLSSAFAKYGLLRCLLLVAQVVIVITSFAVATECKTAPMVNHTPCLVHMGHDEEQEHCHAQLAVLTPLTLACAALLLTHIYTRTNLSPTAILLDIAKPPPRLA